MRGKAGAMPLGHAFAHPAFDVLLIGGGLSLLVTVWIVLRGSPELIDVSLLPWFFLLSNAAHFAASTVRLYTKPDSFRSWPFLTMAFPVLSLLILTFVIFRADQLGAHLQSLYLTWSPYHYAAQAYGIAVVYCYRSGCKIGLDDKRLLRAVALLPFFYNFLTAPDVGLQWLLPASLLSLPWMIGTIGVVEKVLLVLAISTPVLLYLKVRRSASGPMPWIAMLTVVTNGVWFFVLAPLQAFIYATIFHGIQYLAMVIVFHLKDQMARTDNRHGKLYHVVWFYTASLVLGYALFNCLPLAFVFSGFGRVESVLLTVAAINLHHFIVDAFIWRFRKGDANRKIVGADAPLAVGA